MKDTDKIHLRKNDCINVTEAEMKVKIFDQSILTKI